MMEESTTTKGTGALLMLKIGMNFLLKNTSLPTSCYQHLAFRIFDP